MFFDTHAHYDDRSFDSDRNGLLRLMPDNGINLILNAACDMESSKTSIALADAFDHVYASVGLHPHEAKSFCPDTILQMKKLLEHKKAVAIGETGLDYHYDFSPREAQLTAFYAQLELARELDLPVIVHDREAHEDCLKAVRAFPGLKGVFHCYSGSLEMAKELLKLGWTLSFTGSVTFKNAKKAPEIIAFMPDDAFMLETDAPYLAPVPNRGKRNDSRNLIHIAALIAEIRGKSTEDIARLTTENGKRFFGITL